MLLSVDLSLETAARIGSSNKRAVFCGRTARRTERPKMTPTGPQIS